MLPSLSFKQPIGFLLAMNYFNQIPDIIIDGIVDPKQAIDGTDNPQQICIGNNSGASFLNLDAANDFKKISTDLGAYDCTLDPINHTVYP